MKKNDEQLRLLKRDLDSLRNTEELIKQSFKAIKKIDNWREISVSSQKYNSWYVLRDASSNSVCADEIRIKFSENCYQAVPSLSVNELNQSDIRNSFITLVSELKLNKLNKILEDILEKGNKLILITTGNESSLGL